MFFDVSESECENAFSFIKDDLLCCFLEYFVVYHSIACLLIHSKIGYFLRNDQVNDLVWFGAK